MSLSVRLLAKQLDGNQFSRIEPGQALSILKTLYQGRHFCTQFRHPLKTGKQHLSNRVVTALSLHTRLELCIVSQWFVSGPKRSEAIDLCCNSTCTFCIGQRFKFTRVDCAANVVILSAIANRKIKR